MGVAVQCDSGTRRTHGAFRLTETQNSEAGGCLLVEDQTSGVIQFTIHCFPSCSISISNLMSFTESSSNEIYMRGFVLCKSTLTEQYLKTSKLMPASHCREETLREKEIMYVVGCMCVCGLYLLHHKYISIQKDTISK